MSHSLDWVYDWISLALPSYGSENVMRAKQHITIPVDPFVTYDVISLDLSRFEMAVGDSDLYPDPGVVPEVNGTFDRTYQQNCNLQIQIDCYSPSGAFDVQTIVSVARSEAAREIFDAAHVSATTTGTVKNLAYLADNDYRDRWQVVCDFEIALTRTEALNAILEWNLDGEIDGNETLEITIEA